MSILRCSSPEGEAEFLASYDAALAKWPVPYESIHVPTRFGSTHVIASGPKGAPPLVLLHAYGTSATMWLPNVAELSKTYRTYMIDTIGDANKSIYSRPIKSRPEGVEWLSDVLDGLKIEQAHLGGISYGGWLTLNFAMAAPHRLKRVVLLAPAASIAPLSWMFYVRFLAPVLFPTKWVVDSAFRWMSGTGEVVDQGLAEQMYLAIKHFRFPKGGTYPTVFTDDELQSVRVPTLLLIGGREVIYDPNSAIDRATRFIPNIQAAIVPGAGHLPSAEQPAVVNRYILDFLNEARADSNLTEKAL